MARAREGAGPIATVRSRALAEDAACQQALKALKEAKSRYEPLRLALLGKDPRWIRASEAARQAQEAQRDAEQKVQAGLTRENTIAAEVKHAAAGGAVVPEPSTFILAFLGLLGLGLFSGSTGLNRGEFGVPRGWSRQTGFPMVQAMGRMCCRVADRGLRPRPCHHACRQST